jgi:hypothetical protein
MQNLMQQHTPPRDSAMTSAFEDAVKGKGLSLNADELLEKLRADREAERSQQDSQGFSVEMTWDDGDLDNVQAAREKAIRDREQQLNAPDVPDAPPSPQGRAAAPAPEIDIDSDDSDFGEQVKEQRLMSPSVAARPQATPARTRAQPFRSHARARPAARPAPAREPETALPMSHRPVSMTPLAASLLQHADFDPGYDSDFGVIEEEEEEETPVDARAPHAPRPADWAAIESDDCTSGDEDDFAVPSRASLALSPKLAAKAAAALPTPSTSAAPSLSTTSSTAGPAARPSIALPRAPTRVPPALPVPALPSTASGSASGSTTPATTPVSTSTRASTLVRPSVSLPRPPTQPSASNSSTTSTGSAEASRSSVSAIAAMFAAKANPSPASSHTSSFSSAAARPPPRLGPHDEEEDEDEDEDDRPYEIDPALLGGRPAPPPIRAPTFTPMQLHAKPLPASVAPTPAPATPLPARAAPGDSSAPATPLLSPAAFHTVAVLSPAQPAAQQSSLLARELTDSGVLRVLRRPASQPKRTGGTGKMVQAKVWFPQGVCLPVTAWSDMTVQAVVALALELYLEAHPAQGMSSDAAQYEARIYDEEEGEADTDMPALQPEAVFAKLGVEQLAVVPLSVSDLDEDDEDAGVTVFGPGGVSALDYDSDFGEFSTDASGPTPRANATPRSRLTIAASAAVPASAVPAPLPSPLQQAELEDADDYTAGPGPAARSSQPEAPPLPPTTPTSHEEMQFLVHALYARVTAASASEYSEWRVIKTNSKGKRQERWMGLDRHNIHNRAAPKAKEKTGLFSGLGVSRETRPVLSILHCAVAPDSLRCFSISYKNDDRVDTRLYEVDTPLACAEIVAKLRYLINNP